MSFLEILSKSKPSITKALTLIPPLFKAPIVLITLGKVNDSWLKFKIVRSRMISSFNSEAFEMFFFLAISLNTLEYQEITFDECWSKET